MNLKNSYKLLFSLTLLGFILYPKGAVSEIIKEGTFAKETIEYSVKWQNIVAAGSSTLSIEDIDGVYHIEATTISADWLRYLGIKVKDVIKAQSNLKLTKSYSYSANMHEGKYRKKKFTHFDHELKKISYKEDNKESIEFDLKPYILDILSALYLVRTKDFKVGDSIKVSIFDEKKFYDVETLILGHESVDIGDKIIGAYKTKVILQTKGIFDRRGDLYIWFSDDEHKIPILIKSKVSFGSFYVTIANHEIL